MLPTKLVDLRKRKEAILEFGKNSIKDSMQKWFSDVLGRKVAENLALGSEEEVIKLEAEVNRIKKLGLT